MKKPTESTDTFNAFQKVLTCWRKACIQSACISTNYSTRSLLQPPPQPVPCFTDQLLSNSFYSYNIFQGSQRVHYTQSHHYPQHRLHDFHTTLFSGIVSSFNMPCTNACYFPSHHTPPSLSKKTAWEIQYR